MHPTNVTLFIYRFLTRRSPFILPISPGRMPELPFKKFPQFEGAPRTDTM